MVDLAWVGLSLTRHVGGKTMRALLAVFGDAAAVLRADEQQLEQVPGVGKKIAGAIRGVDLAQVERRVDDWQRQGVKILTWEDECYPAKLRVVDDAPPTLFVRGQFPWLDDDLRGAYAIVGTRSPSPRYKGFASQLGNKAADHPALVVSGLAIGVDTFALTNAVEVGQRGRSVAVLGSGVLAVYPPENMALAEAIMQHGALVCEVAPDAPVSAPGLVARNRIISGLSDAVIVVQTEINGGAMHAARFARAQGRAVYAYRDSGSGNEQLIETGALPPDRLPFHW